MALSSGVHEGCLAIQVTHIDLDIGALQQQLYGFQAAMCGGRAQGRSFERTTCDVGSHFLHHASFILHHAS
jgi:hypothetical protein